MKRNGAGRTTFLAVLLVCTLVFALTAATALRVFAGAAQTAERADDTRRAVYEATRAAESFRLYADDRPALAAELGGVWSGDTLEAAGGTGLTLRLEAQRPGADGRVQHAEICVLRGEETLFSLTCAAGYGEGAAQ